MPTRETWENKTHSTLSIPYSFYECRIPEMDINVAMHWHDEFEINRILKGKGEFICGDEKILAAEGDLLFLPPDMLHAAYPLEGKDLIYQALVFHPTMLGMESKDRSSQEYILPMMEGKLQPRLQITGQEENYVEAKQVVDRIFSYSGLGNRGDISHAASPREDLLIKGNLLQLFGILEYREVGELKEEGSISYSRLIRPALEYMVENYEENITVELLAKEAHLSKSYFMSCFKKAAGISAMEYLTQYRMGMACQLLAETALSIAQVAYSCGYNNLSNFNRQFLKQIKCSPREYRQNRQKEKAAHF